MLLEVKVFGSTEWFDDVAPKMDILGFKVREDLTWADPETDGELKGFYYTYEGKDPMPFDEFVETIKDMEEIINAGEAPYIKFAIVPYKEKNK